MNKKTLLSILLVFALSSCNNVDNSKVEEESSLSSIDQASSIEETSSLDEKSSEEKSLIESTNQESNTDISLSSDDELIFDDSLFDPTKIVLGVGESYNLEYTCNNKDHFWIEIKSNNKNVAVGDLDNNIVTKGVGSTIMKVIVDDDYYDNIEVEVIEDNRTTFSTSKGYLYGKTFTILGASASDTTVTAYPDNRPTFWCEMLENKLNMTVHNFAKSGSTIGYCRGLFDKGDYSQIIACSVINNTKTKEAIENSDYVFLNLGNNDGSYGCNLGDYDDVNDDNYLTCESLKGSYSYLLKKIYSYNPNVRIVVLGNAYSSWYMGPYEKNTYENYTYAKNRDELSTILEDIASHNHAKFIKLVDLWDSSNIKEMAPDGTHPQTKGYELMVKRILEEI